MLSLLADTTSTFWLPETAAKNAPRIDWLFNWILWVNIFFTVLIIVMMLWFAFRYRKRPGNEEGGVGGHNNALEITWTVIPTIIVVLIYYYGFKGFLHASVEPPTAYEITATGRMWSWSFQYPNGYIGNELHVPPNVPVRVVLRSEDVIHDLWVPAFRVKKDVVPGRFNRMWFEADKPGTYDLYCAVYCGQNHSTMRSIAVVHKDRDEFDKWLEDASTELGKLSYVEIGKKIYETRGCMSCHSINGSKIVGPTWKDMYGSTIPLADGRTVQADDAYVRESVLEPAAKIHLGYPNVMPSFRGQLKDYQIEGLIWFMRSNSSHFPADQMRPGTSPTTKPAPTTQAVAAK